MLLNIEKLVYGGDGLARLPADEHGPGKAVFLPFVLEGERVEATLLEQKRGFARGRVERIVEPSRWRIEAQCPYFQRCGGCHYQHVSYEHQLEIKVAILKENLRRIAKLELDTEVVVHSSPEWNYRNRTRLKVQTKPEFAVGYHRLNSHELQAITQCPISSPIIHRAIAVLAQMKPAGWAEEIQEIELFANAEDTQLLAQVDCRPDIRKSAAIQVATEIKSILPDAVGVVSYRGSGGNHGPVEEGRIATIGSGEIMYQVRDLSYRASAGAFFQVNRHLVSTLVELVTQGMSGEAALDLYAGVGLFSSVLAKSFAQVTAVEASPTSHGDLLYNSPSNVKAVRATTEQFLKNVAGEMRPNLVVVDPPRNGLGEMVVRGLADLGANHIVYVSCDPATLCRDLAGLLAAGYHVQQAHVADLFPQTYHVESVFHLMR